MLAALLLEKGTTLGVTLICQATHYASPSVSAFDKGDIGVDISATSSAPRNDSIGHYRDWAFLIPQRGIGADCKRKREFGFLQERVALRYTSQS
jgi:hypothetical protein